MGATRKKKSEGLKNSKGRRAIGGGGKKREKKASGKISWLRLGPELSTKAKIGPRGSIRHGEKPDRTKRGEHQQKKKKKKEKKESPSDNRKTDGDLGKIFEATQEGQAKKKGKKNWSVAGNSVPVSSKKKKKKKTNFQHTKQDRANEKSTPCALNKGTKRSLEGGTRAP